MPSFPDIDELLDRALELASENAARIGSAKSRASAEDRRAWLAMLDASLDVIEAFIDFLPNDGGSGVVVSLAERRAA